MLKVVSARKAPSQLLKSELCRAHSHPMHDSSTDKTKLKDGPDLTAATAGDAEDDHEPDGVGHNDSSMGSE